MPRGRLVAVALAMEGALALVAWELSRRVPVAVAWGVPARDVVVGLIAALALAAVNHAMLTRARQGWVVNGVRAVYHEVLLPIFGTLDPIAAIAIGVAAGIGEEWLFRGVLQPWLGWAVASALFGLAHVGGRAMLPFGVWASAMGAALGVLAHVTGGIIAPIVAHGMYDVLALAYIRRRTATERGMRS